MDVSPGDELEARGRSRSRSPSSSASIECEENHRFAYELLVGPIQPGEWVLHKCDNPPCVNPAHLWLGDNDANVEDMVAKGRHRHGVLLGSSNGNAKLTEVDAREILRLHAEEGLCCGRLALRFGVSRSAINHIFSDYRWKHLVVRTA